MSDEVQASEQTESEGASETETQEETQKTQDQEQSEESEGKKYKLDVMGEEKELTADELHEWAKKVNPEFTQRSQKLAEYEKQEKERNARAETETRQSVAENPYLKNLNPDVKEAIVQIVQPVIDQGLQQRDEAEAIRRRDEAFNERLDALEKEFPGGNGKPKFNRQEVIQAMQEPGNTNFDPRSKFEGLHQEEFNDLLVKEALKKQKGGVETERTGSSGPRKPDRKQPKSIREAGDALLSRLKQSS